MKKEYRNSLRTKKMIRLAFIELLGEKEANERITVAEIAERADIAKSTFYNHYDDVYAVSEEFQLELIRKLGEIFMEMERDKTSDYGIYIKKIIEFLKTNDAFYRKVIKSPEAKFFIEKLKQLISKKVFEENGVFPFSPDKRERYIQVRFLTNACVNTLVDYFEGRLNATLDDVGEVISDMVYKVR